MAKTTKKAKLSVKKSNALGSDYTAAILEEMRSDFRAFGEALGFTNKNVAELKENVSDLKEKFEVFEVTLDEVKTKGDATFEKVGEIDERLTMVEINQVSMQKDINVIKQDVGVLKQDVMEINSHLEKIDGRLDNIEREVAFLRREFDRAGPLLTKKEDVEYFKGLDLRLRRVESHLNLKVA